MGNSQCSYHSSPFLCHANFCPQILKFAAHSVPTKTSYHVFINHRGKDVKETIATLVFRDLESKGLKVFFDKNSIQVGHKIQESIEQAIRTSYVHIAIFSPNYADSEWCLYELCLMLKTRSPIIPVFWQIQPSELRMENKDGMYARAFRMHKQVGKHKTRILKKWKEALRYISAIKGIIFNGNQEELMEEIFTCVTKIMSTRCQTWKFPAIK